MASRGVNRHTGSGEVEIRQCPLRVKALQVVCRQGGCEVRFRPRTDLMRSIAARKGRDRSFATGRTGGFMSRPKCRMARTSRPAGNAKRSGHLGMRWRSNPLPLVRLPSPGRVPIGTAQCQSEFRHCDRSQSIKQRLLLRRCCLPRSPRQNGHQHSSRHVLKLPASIEYPRSASGLRCQYIDACLLLV